MSTTKKKTLKATESMLVSRADNGDYVIAYQLGEPCYRIPVCEGYSHYLHLPPEHAQALVSRQVRTRG